MRKKRGSHGEIGGSMVLLFSVLPVSRELMDGSGNVQGGLASGSVFCLAVPELKVAFPASYQRG